MTKDGIPENAVEVHALCEEWWAKKAAMDDLDRRMTPIRGAISLAQQAIRNGDLSLGAPDDFLLLAFGKNFPEARNAFTRYREQLLDEFVGDLILAVKWNAHGVAYDFQLGRLNRKGSGLISTHKEACFDTVVYIHGDSMSSHTVVEEIRGAMPFVNLRNVQSLFLASDVAESFHEHVSHVGRIARAHEATLPFLFGGLAIANMIASVKNGLSEIFLRKLSIALTRI